MVMCFGSGSCEGASAAVAAVAADGGVARAIPEEAPSGAKTPIDAGVFAARLKSCPDTGPVFSVAGEVSAGFVYGLDPAPFTEGGSLTTAWIAGGAGAAVS